jgi:low affinity Fe/Cu permease
MDNTLYLVLGVAVFVVLGYIFALRDLIRQSRALDQQVDYSKLRPQPPDEDDY